MLIAVAKRHRESVGTVFTFMGATSDHERATACDWIAQAARGQRYDHYAVFKAHPGTHKSEGAAASADYAHLIAEYDAAGCVMWCDPLQTESDWQISF